MANKTTTRTALVKALGGKEYIYQPSSAHGVSKASAQVICDALNKIRHDLKAGQVWRVITFDQYDSAFDIAACYKFVIRGGYLRETRPAWCLV